MQNDSFLGGTNDFVFKVKHDPDAKTASIIDSGLELSKADLINNLGTSVDVRSEVEAD